MKRFAVNYLVLAALAAASAAAQEWEVFFDPEGFESLPVGTLHGTEPSLLPHVLSGYGTGIQLPSFVAPPEPVIGDRSIRLEPSHVTPRDTTVRIDYRHRDVRFGERLFTFPGAGDRGGYRAMRVSLDIYHAHDPRPGMARWAGGGIEPRDFGEPATVQIVRGVTERLEPVFDQWVHVSLTYHFERELVAGTYDGHDSGFVPMPAELLELPGWWFQVDAAVGDPPAPDIESVWLDNLVMEVIPPCAADCDVDYVHTFFDFLCFQNMFATGNMRADCDLDGDLTVFDFLCFQNYFAAGCD